MSDKKRLFKSVIIGSLSGIVVTIILMCLMSVSMMSIGILHEDIINYVTVGLLGVGAFGGGFLASKINKGAGLVVGAITGALMFLIVVIAALSDGSDISVLIIIKLAVTVALGSLGGIAGLKERKKISI